ncbi:MAG: putative transport system permease protein [Frankiaceae bacterium]|nr:putative transport system permease protein [Frankiaceae bacterium]
MLRIALKTVLARKLRLVTTAFAVVLGVAFMSGALVLTDTVGRSFNSLFADIYKNTDAMVRSSQTLKSDNGDLRPRIDAAVLATVQKADKVAQAAPFVTGYAQIVGKDGKQIGNPGQGAPTFGTNWVEDAELNSFRLAEGHAPQTDAEIVIDKGSAGKGKLAVGDHTTVLTSAGAIPVTIAGIAKFGTADSPLGASFAMFTTARAQEVVAEPGRYDSILIRGTPGASQQAVRDSLAKVLPSGTEAVTGAQVTKENQNDIKKGLKFFSIFLLVFAGVAVVVGAFIIYNTFSIIVAQRGREMALMRAIGASRRQVLGAVLIEAFSVGLIAGIVGLGAGIGVAIGLKALLAAFGLDIPAGGSVILPRTVVASLVVGVGVSLASAFFPARRASKIPPVAAMRAMAQDTSGRSVVRVVSGLAATALGAASLANGLFGKGANRLQSVGIGVLVIFIGITILGPIFAARMSSIIGAPLPRMRGMAGTLARENAKRNPRRTSATAAALMIGVGLVGFITIFAASTKASVNASLDKSFTGDFVIATNTGGFGGLSPQLAASLKKLPEVGVVASGRFTPVDMVGSNAVLALDQGSWGKIVDVQEKAGKLTDLSTENTIAVYSKEATKRGLKIGDAIPVTFLKTGKQSLKIVAIFGNKDLTFGDYVIGLPTYDKNMQEKFDSLIYIRKADGVSADSARTAIEKTAAAYPLASVKDNTEYKSSVSKQIDGFVNLIYALLALAVIIALFGIANTLALSIFERTSELGLLRAVGMTRRQVRTMVRWESVIIALLGTFLGLVIGLFFGWALVQALKNDGINILRVPVAQLVVVTIVAGVAGVVAAIVPARRAAKLDVLQAIATT